MHIEISAGGLSGMTATSNFLSDLDSYIKKADTVISDFATVKSSIGNLNGGAGVLQDAMNQVNKRIEIEQEKKEHAQQVKEKANSFFDLAVRVDQEVAELVKKNKDEFYRVNPWLRPTSEKPWYEKVFDWICKTGKAIADGVKDIIRTIGDGFKIMGDAIAKLWNTIKETYEKKGFLWKVINIAGKVLGAVVAVVACVAAIMAGPALAIVGAVMIIYTLNTVINNVIDVVNIINGNVDQVGKTNVLKDVLTESFGAIGELIGGETGGAIGRGIGKALYYVGEIVNVCGQIEAVAGKVTQAPDMWAAIKGGFGELKDATQGAWYLVTKVNILDLKYEFKLLQFAIPNLVNLGKDLKIIADVAKISEKVIISGLSAIAALAMFDIEVPSFKEAIGIESEDSIFSDIKSIYDDAKGIDKHSKTIRDQYSAMKLKKSTR